MKTVDEIYREMLVCYGEHTGLNLEEGCDLAVRLYAAAAQIYSLWVQTDWVSRQVFPQTAAGEYLDLHAQLRGVERKQAQKAEGIVRFLLEEPAHEERIVSKGTVCMTAGLIRFETTESGMIHPGDLWVEVPVQAINSGSMGNVAAGSITGMAVAPVGVAACTNPEPCTGGGDQENDEELRSRVLETYRRMPNGANAAFYQQEALSFEDVAAAAVVSRPRGVGTVDVVVTELEGLPDQELLDRLKEHFDRCREIAVDVQVRAPETSAVDLKVAVAAREGVAPEQAAAQAEAALRECFGGKRLGQDVLRAELANRVYCCDGVANYTILLPEEDIKVASDVLPIINSLVVEEMA